MFAQKRLGESGEATPYSVLINLIISSTLYTGQFPCISLTLRINLRAGFIFPLLSAFLPLRLRLQFRSPQLSQGLFS